jgi:catechol 2,3-dioxygenase-like lactoylglutathione lyase family enzyme
MIKVTTAQMWVLDQEEALAFYTDKLGWEVRMDVTLPEVGDFRWLTVGPPEQEDFQLVLMAIPGPPVFEEDTANMLRELVARGVTAPIFLSTDDIHADYETLKSRGVEFVDEPEERPYGFDSSFRDPSGNQLRMTQVKDLSAFNKASVA